LTLTGVLEDVFAGALPFSLGSFASFGSFGSFGSLVSLGSFDALGSLAALASLTGSLIASLCFLSFLRGISSGEISLCFRLWTFLLSFAAGAGALLYR
jgi:hypothetical protein